MNTKQIHSPRFTRSFESFEKTTRNANLLDNLKRAFSSAVRLYLTHKGKELARLAEASLLAIRRNVSNFFGSFEIADSFLMGGYW